MPKSVRGSEIDANKLEVPPNISIFWSILRRYFKLLYILYIKSGVRVFLGSFI